MDTVGAFLGPLAAMLLFWFHGNIVLVLWAAVIPSVVAVLLIVFGVLEPDTGERKIRHFHSPLQWSVLGRFPRAFWWVVFVGALFTLAHFSEAFLVLRAQQAGLAITWIPVVMVVMSVAYALSAYPAGILSDRMDKKLLLAMGLVFLIAADLLLAESTSIVLLMLGVAAWGLHMGFSQGILATLVAETTPPELKGTAFGLFNFISGMLLLFASLLAGWLWDSYGYRFTFYCGAAFSILALVVLAFGRMCRR